jgi:Leucine-rich repeat (LRR) protein
MNYYKIDESALVYILNNIPEDIRQYIIELTGIFLPWSKESYLKGWRRFDFILSLKKDIHFKARQNIYIRNKKQLKKLTKIYPNLKLHFEKTYDHMDMEIITGLSWDELLKKSNLEINGFEPDKKDYILNQKTPNGRWKIPHVIGQLTQLQKLGITECTCDFLPKSLGKLRNLKEFWWIDNDYDVEIPKTIECLKKLEKISCETKGVIPYGITRLPFLSELYLYGENIDLYDLSDMKSLEVLLIHKCKFLNNTIPSWIGKLKNIKEIIIEHSNIEKIDRQILDLNLDYLCLKNNQIQELPSWFYKIKSTHISLVNNEIEELPNVPMSPFYTSHINFLEIYNNPLRIIRDLHIVQQFTNIIIGDDDEFGSTSLCEQDKQYIRSKNNINILNTFW